MTRAQTCQFPPSLSSRKYFGRVRAQYRCPRSSCDHPTVKAELRSLVMKHWNPSALSSFGYRPVCGASPPERTGWKRRSVFAFLGSAASVRPDSSLRFTAVEYQLGWNEALLSSARTNSGTVVVLADVRGRR